MFLLLSSCSIKRKVISGLSACCATAASPLPPAASPLMQASLTSWCNTPLLIIWRTALLILRNTKIAPPA
jgi:hypothetical protein